MKKHIILIEDDPDILYIVGYALEQAGYKVTRFEAFTTFEELIDLQADCFLVDEQLPGISGHIICIILKSKPQTNAIPVILMSASKESAGFANLCNADTFLQKPFEITRLLHVLHSIIGA
jgi:DNA-binding response OmpR family regulator